MSETTEETAGSNPGSNFGLDEARQDMDGILSNVSIDSVQLGGAGVASPDEINKVLKKIVADKKIKNTRENVTKVWLSVLHAVQIGATSPKYADGRTITDYGVSIKVSDLRSACKSAGITVRKFVRGVRDDVIKVAVKHGIEGNLSKNYKLENPGFEQQDLVWVSDFQTFSDNPAMPEHVKHWLLENYRNRFRPNVKPATGKTNIEGSAD